MSRLAGALASTLVLLDLHHGAHGLAAQLAELTWLTGADRVEVVEVGGDALARGNESGLRSTLADALAPGSCGASRQVRAAHHPSDASGEDALLGAGSRTR